MNNILSFMSANYVARQVGYDMTGGWGQGDRAANAHYQPVDTFPERFGELLRDVRALGFEAVDVWTSHLNPTWATPQHIETARDLLQEHDLRVPSLGGWFGSSPQEFEASCRIAEALGGAVLGGSTSMLQKDRTFVMQTLRAAGLRLGIENHPEKTPEELRETIGDGDGMIGATVDTGWFGTQGYDAAAALGELRDVLFYVHLKDVREVGAHETCRYGEGVVPLRRCVEVLDEIGYRDAICVEHEPERFDPTEDVRASRELLEGWMADHGA